MPDVGATNSANSSTNRKRRIAVLIDGDNAQPSLIEEMLLETNKYGIVIIKRIYGDWTEPNMNGWKKVMQFHAVQPIQQFRNTTGKNATDSALIIDAMDLLHQEVADSFCLISSDSDYTRLATRIRESGRFVIGIGKKNTPTAFVSACDVFIYTENLTAEPIKAIPAMAKEPQKQEVGKPAKTTKPNAKTSQKQKVTEPAKASKPTKAAPQQKAKDASPNNTVPDPLPLLLRAYEIVVQDNGWASMSALGAALKQVDPGFDLRTYKVRQLSVLLKAYPKIFKVDDTQVYVNDPTVWNDNG
jgi:uncharacterized LabA/DUF88 family protein